MKNKMLPALGLIALTGCANKLPEKPNIIYLMFDDLGYGDLGCYGQKVIETPNIDALAERGIVFTDMYTACPISAPPGTARSATTRRGLNATSRVSRTGTSPG